MSKYKADLKNLVVTDIDEHECTRKLRRIVVQRVPSADAEMHGVDDGRIVQALNSGNNYCWQVAYVRMGVEYWWDYDTKVNSGLEVSLRYGELLEIEWNWGNLKDGQVTYYVADPLRGVVKNTKTEYDRKIRRYLSLSKRELDCR